MEVQRPVIPHLGESRVRILDNIKERGFEQQNEELYKMGFTKLSQNLKYLKLYQGDIQKILEELKEKRSRKRDKGSPQKENDPNHSLKNQDGVFDQVFSKKNHPKKERIPKPELKEYNEWPNGIERVYLDGNNMLYVEDAMRKFAIGRKKKKAEKKLIELALEFTKYLKGVEVVLLFDSTSLISHQKVQTENGEVDFSVLSASPKFETSDDAFVSWSESLGEKKEKCLFVTSDRGLQVRLVEREVEQIMKPKKWFGFAKACLGEINYNNILNSQEE